MQVLIPDVNTERAGRVTTARSLSGLPQCRGIRQDRISLYIAHLPS